MKVVAPKPFTFEGGKRAVLLLHGFTGTTADVRMLGRYLQKQGYTCHAPLYEGHGVPPEKLVQTGPEDWWGKVAEGYQFLKDEGFEEIAVAGLSLGGVFSLKCGYTLRVKGIVSMCAPMRPKEKDTMHQGILTYAKGYKELERKSAAQIEVEMEALKQPPTKMITELMQLIDGVRTNLDQINTPVFVVQARHDETIDVQSAQIIYEQVNTNKTFLKWYEESTHVITLGKEKEQLHHDIHRFLEGLDWTV
ncbi:carboxylesterase [bacterium LRH843]|nr:carboxylesterase [bacterium LRH843]